MAEEEKDGKDYKIIEAIGGIDNAKPYVKRYEGLAVKVEKDTEVKYKDWDKDENTMIIPAGAIVKIMDDGCRAEVVTEEDFNKKYVFHDEGEEVKEEAEEANHKGGKAFNLSITNLK